MTAQTQQDPPATLNYGRYGSRRRRRWIGLAIVVVLLLAVYPVKRWGPPAWHQAVLLRAQRACLKYRASPEQLVYDEDQTNARKLMAADQQYGWYPIGRDKPGKPESPDQAAAAFIPTCWLRFDKAAGMTWHAAGNPGATVFLGERTSPSGHRRLLCVRYFPEQSTFASAFIAGYNYEANAIAPGTFITPPVQAMRAYAIDVLSGWPRHPPRVRMWAGQPDSNDPSHFTIRYEMWGQSDVLDGRLLDNDDVTLTPRHLPEDPK